METTINVVEDTKIASGSFDRTFLLVLGMHRSGTSAVTRLLSLLGASLPKNIMGAGVGNELGHWEPDRLVRLHDEMLLEAGSSWDDWNMLDLTKLGHERLGYYKSEIMSIIEDEFDDAYLFVIKDPRICKFTPFFISCLEELQVNARVVLAFRNPLEVISSLRRRDNMDRMDAVLLWLTHNLAAEQATRGMERAFIDYTALLDGWRGGIKSKAV